jgi:hypothetical protein
MDASAQEEAPGRRVPTFRQARAKRLLRRQAKPRHRAEKVRGGHKACLCGHVLAADVRPQDRCLARVQRQL